MLYGPEQVRCRSPAVIAAIPGNGLFGPWTPDDSHGVAVSVLFGLSAAKRVTGNVAAKFSRVDFDALLHDLFLFFWIKRVRLTQAMQWRRSVVIVRVRGCHRQQSSVETLHHVGLPSS